MFKLISKELTGTLLQAYLKVPLLFSVEKYPNVGELTMLAIE